MFIIGFKIYFTPIYVMIYPESENSKINRVLFTFPLRYSFTIGLQKYLSFEGGPPNSTFVYSEFIVPPVLQGSHLLWLMYSAVI